MRNSKRQMVSDVLVQDLDSEYSDIAPAIARIIDHFSIVMPAAEQHKMELLQARLALGEALANVVEHAYGGENGHKYQVRSRVMDNKLLFEIEDQGRPMPVIDLQQLEDNDLPPNIDDLPEGGFGMAIINKEMDGVFYRRNYLTNHLTLVKDLQFDDAKRC